MKKQGVFLQDMSDGAVEANIDIVGVIGWEVAFTELRRMFSTLSDSVKRVVFNIYSPGGDVWDGNGIVQAIGELGKTRETVARVQVAASMATLIAVACKTRSIASNGRFLIHNAWTVTQGDAADHEKAAQTLRDCEQEAAKFYATRTNKTPAEMLALMAEERWLMPDETLALGFVQAIDDPFEAAAYAGIRAEIEAAGKWPKALVELPKAEETASQTGEADAHKPDTGTKANEAAQQTASESPAVPSVSDYERGRIDAESAAQAAHAQILESIEKRLTAETKARAELQAKYDALDVLQRRTQGERDAARASVEKLTASLKAATTQVERLLSGGMSFAPDVQTWADALKACGNDYEKARVQYPDLYRESRNQQKASRKE